MKITRALPALLCAVLTCLLPAQQWKVTVNTDRVTQARTTILSTLATEPTNNNRVSGGKERPVLSIAFDLDGTELVALGGHFRLLANRGADSYDGMMLLDSGESCSVPWTISPNGASMTASKIDMESIIFKLRHAKKATFVYNTAGNGEQFVAFSLVGLDAALRKAGWP